MQSFKSKPGVDIVVVADAFVVVIAIVDPKEGQKFVNKYLFRITKL